MKSNLKRGLFRAWVVLSVLWVVVSLIVLLTNYNACISNQSFGLEYTYSRPTNEQLINALKKADAAGDIEAVGAISKMLVGQDMPKQNGISEQGLKELQNQQMDFCNEVALPKVFGVFIIPLIILFLSTLTLFSIRWVDLGFKQSKKL